jgi:hypothetical protein
VANGDNLLELWNAQRLLLLRRYQTSLAREIDEPLCNLDVGIASDDFVGVGRVRLAVPDAIVCKHRVPGFQGGIDVRVLFGVELRVPVPEAARLFLFASRAGRQESSILSVETSTVSQKLQSVLLLSLWRNAERCTNLESLFHVTKSGNNAIGLISRPCRDVDGDLDGIRAAVNVGNIAKEGVVGVHSNGDRQIDAWPLVEMITGSGRSDKRSKQRVIQVHFAD